MPAATRRTFVLTLAPSVGLVLSLGLSEPGDDPDAAALPTEPLAGRPMAQHGAGQPAWSSHGWRTAMRATA